MLQTGRRSLGSDDYVKWRRARQNSVHSSYFRAKSFDTEHNADILLRFVLM